MLTSDQITEILKQFLRHDTDIKIHHNILMTQQTTNADGSRPAWVRHGRVHDMDEAVQTIENYFRATGDKRGSATGRQQPPSQHSPVRVLAVPPGLQHRVKELLDAVHAGGALPAGGVELDPAVLGALEEPLLHGITHEQVQETAEDLLLSPTMDELPADVLANDPALAESLRQGTLQTGLPKGLILLIEEHVVTLGCNCGKCLVARMYPKLAAQMTAGTISGPGYLKVLTMRYIVDKHGPQANIGCTAASHTAPSTCPDCGKVHHRRAVLVPEQDSPAVTQKHSKWVQ